MQAEGIQEIRGSMTRFEKVTPEQVAACSGGDLTYEQLAIFLAKYGLSIEFVLHDPSRSFQNTFYADFDNALYRALYLSRNYLEGGGLADLESFSRLVREGNVYLKDKDWDSLYFHTVPLPMAIFDFQKRLRDIEPAKVFGVWYSIHKRIDYANGMWQPETLDYVFSHAPVTEKPPVDANGLVTLYRGMGALSAPPEAAISWSIHPGNALWFANHTGRGTRLVLAEAASTDVVAFFPGYQHENEVLVRPGTVKNVRYEDMLPANEDTVVKLTIPALLEYQFYGRQIRKFGYRLEASPFEVHGVNHILRVLMLSLIYVYNSREQFTEGDRSILVYFSLLHDVGRTSEGTDDFHGDASVEMIQSKGLRIRAAELTAKEFRIAHLLIRYHCRDDSDGIAAIQSQQGFSRKDKTRAVWLYKICKDMDGLDRVRFNGLDYRMLRTPFARRLPLVAGCLLHEDMKKALGEPADE